MKLENKELRMLCSTAVEAAKAAGSFIQSRLTADYHQSRKEGHTRSSQVVTEVDIKAQAIIFDYLRSSIQLYDLGLLAEESADDRSRLDKEYFWAIDPLDGTLAFTQGTSGYAVSIALVNRKGSPVVGVVYIPDLEQCYTAIKNQGTFLNGSIVKQVNNSDTLHIYMDRSLKSLGNFKTIKHILEEWAHDRNIPQVKYHVGYGAVRNAIGVIESPFGCYFKFPKAQEGGGGIWDFAATRLLAEESGIEVSNAYGEDLNLNDPDSVFMNRKGVTYATNNELFKIIIKMDHHQA